MYFDLIRHNLTFFLLITLATLAYSQSGPGGFENTSGSSDLVLWLRADDGVLNSGGTAASNGESVATWQDRSGYNYNAISAATSPLYTTSGIGGMPSITFAGGSTEFLYIEDDADEAPQLDGTSEISVFYVFNQSTVSGLNAHISKRDGNGSQQSYLAFENGSLNSRVNANNDAGQTVVVSTDYINSITYQNGDFDHFLNQVSGGGITGGTSSIPNNNSDFHIGTLNSGDSRNMHGDIAEIIVIRRYLTNAERIVVETYLASKYGISLTNDFWDETTYTAYDNEIAGIGQHTDGTIAEAATSAVLTISGGDNRANGEWLFWGHDSGDILTWDDSFSEVPGTEERLSREWVVNETGDLGDVTVSIDGSQLPSTGFSIPNYYLLVDTDGDADFSDATRYPLVSNGAVNSATVDLNNGDHIAIAFEGGTESQIWYSYVSGDWNDPSTWTLDGAISPLYNNPSSEVPDEADTVVIQSGRTVTMNINDVAVTQVEIIGTLDLAATTGSTFGVLKGAGTLRLSGASSVDNYPTADDASFIDADDGGTLEYYGTGLTLSSARSANNLSINLTNTTDVIMTLADVTVSSNITITSGIFQINDNSATTSLNVNVTGDLLVGANGSIDVGTASARHELNLYGDFTNQGDVDFTNRTSQDTESEATDGIVDVNFLSANQDQTVDLQNTTDFYRIEINKGVDNTYIVDLEADDAAYFNLYGPANTSLGGPQASTNDNALGLIYGTVKVGENVVISPLLTSGNSSIFEGARLWVDGGTVEITSANALVLYGEAKVTSGFLNIPVVNGITTRDNGQLTLEGGTVTTNQLKTSTNGSSSLGGINMSGGVFNVTGTSSNTSHYVFSLTYEGNVFNMTGGTLNISGANTTGGIYINSSDENYNVTGGTVNLEINNNNDFTITSRAPFFNLNILKSGGTGSAVITGGSSGTGTGETTLDLEEITIINDLHIDNSGGNGTTLDVGGVDMNITGSLIIDNGASVDFSDMNLAFVGDGSSTIDIGLASTLVLDSLEINKNQALVNVGITNGQSTAVQIDELLNVTSGNFNLNSFDVTVNGNIILSDTIGLASSTGQILMSGSAAQSITSSTGAIYDLEINNANGVSLSGDMGIINVLDLNTGILDIGTAKLSLNQEVATTGSFSNSLMVQSAGNASDGGIDVNISADGTYLFPFGVSGKYTPASMDIALTSGNTGNVAINPVDAELSTTDLSGGNILSYYWKVNHADFGTSDLPTINSYTFTFDASDVSAGTPDTEYVSGKVLDESPYTRSYEGAAGIQVTSSTLVFDGLAQDDDGTGARSGFQIENANYTAGASARFVGEPYVYYTKDNPADGGFNLLFEWDNPAVWVRSDQLTDMNGDMVIDEQDWHRGDNPSSPDFPGAGDIAVIGFVPWEDPNITNRGLAHHLNIASEVEECAELIFTKMTDAAGDPVARTNIFFALRPAVLITGGAGQLNADVVKGEGEFFIRFGGDPDFSVMDLGDFNAEDSSIVFYEAASNRTYNNAPSEVSNLILGTANWGTWNLNIQFSTDITIRQNLEILGNANLLLNSGASGDIIVSNNLFMFETDAVPLPCCGGSSLASGGGAEIRYPNTGNSRSITVNGDIILENTGGIINVGTPGTTPLEHSLTVGGNITQNTTSGGGLQLFSDISEDRITLNLTGDGTHAFDLTSGADPAFYRVVMNKGTDTTSTFTFNTNFTLGGDNTVAPQALELQNGKLVLNNSSINIELANSSDFSIPASTGLEISQGTVTSTDARFILDGLMRINGGTATLSTTDIEYSTTGSAFINVTSGTLNIGGQVRRSTSSTAGILKYRQTGGDVDIATDGASTTSRGVFEVLNSGSEFTLTGGTFNLDRGVTGDANLSLILDPSTVDVTGSTITIYDNLASDYGASYFNISSSVPLNNITVGNSIDLPDVRLFNQNLEINNLVINSNQTVLTNGFNLTLNGNFTNEGTYTSTSSETIFGGVGAQSISGAGTYSIYDLRKSGSGTTTANVSLDLGNDFFLNSGTFDVGANSLSLQNDAFVESTFLNTGGNGLVFNGTDDQNLSGLTNNAVNIGTITISNPSGVDIPDGNGFDFNITQELRLNGGVFNIGGSLVTMEVGASITEVSSFNANNMVQTNSSFTDNGLQINFSAIAGSTSLFFPVGELNYTPIDFVLTSSSAGSIRVRPANESHPTVSDATNALAYHWVVTSDGVTGATGNAEFTFDPSDIMVSGINTSADYEPVRLTESDNGVWDKSLDTSSFDEAGNTFTFPMSNLSSAEITGEYTAGVEDAIPNEVASYETSFVGSGNYSSSANWTKVNINSPDVTEGVGPVGAEVVIRNGNTLTLDLNDIRLFSTEIEAGGVLVIPSGATGLRLGEVTGTGTIVLEDNELLPAGEYTEFLACDGGAIQYSGTTSYSVLSGISQIRKVILEGSGSRVFPNNLVTVCDTLEVNGPTIVLNSGNTYTIGDVDTDVFDIQAGSVSLSNGSTIDVNGSFEISGGSFTGSSNTIMTISGGMNFSGGTLNWNGTDITLDGSATQLLDGAFTGTAGFDDLTINNSGSGITINSGDVEVNGMLTLTDGLVTTTSSETLTLTSTGDWTNASSASYITGPISKQNISVAATYQFPVGKTARYAPISVVNVMVGGDDWTAEYFTSIDAAYPSTSFDDTDPGSGLNALTNVRPTDRWQIASVGSNQAQIRASYGAHNSFTGTDEIRLVWWDDEGSRDGDVADNRWENQGGTISGDAISGTVTSENSVFFSTRQFALGRAPEVALPIELSAFTAVEKNKQVVLSWTTLSELNNDFFEVYHSVDGKTFRSIGTIMGSGTISHAKTYSLVHRNPSLGNNFYQLKQVDFDGSEEVFRIIRLQINPKQSPLAVTVYPNPTSNDNLNIRLSTDSDSKPISIRIMDLKGGFYYQNIINDGAASFDKKIDPSISMPPGIYFVIVQQGNKMMKEKVIIK